MLFLWFFGTEVEYFIGPKYFTRLYFMSGIFGAMLWLAFNFTPYLIGGHPIYASCIGASAGVLGCVVAFATLFPDRDVTLLVFFILPITLRAKYLAMIAVAIDAAMLLMGGSGVANLAIPYGRRVRLIVAHRLTAMADHAEVLFWFHRTSTVRPKPRPRPTPRNMVLRVKFVREQVDPIPMLGPQWHAEASPPGTGRS